MRKNPDKRAEIVAPARGGAKSACSPAWTARTQGCVSVCRTAAAAAGAGEASQEERDPLRQVSLSFVRAPLLILSSFSLFRFLFAGRWTFLRSCFSPPELTLGEPFCASFSAACEMHGQAKRGRRRNSLSLLAVSLFLYFSPARYSLFAPVNSLISRKYGFELLDWFLRWRTLLISVFISTGIYIGSSCEEMSLIIKKRWKAPGQNNMAVNTLYWRYILFLYYEATVEIYEVN